MHIYGKILVPTIQDSPRDEVHAINSYWCLGFPANLDHFLDASARCCLTQASFNRQVVDQWITNQLVLVAATRIPTNTNQLMHFCLDEKYLNIDISWISEWCVTVQQHISISWAHGEPSVHWTILSCFVLQVPSFDPQPSGKYTRLPAKISP